METTVTYSVNNQEWPRLNAFDRCDACGAAARVRVSRNAQDMVWCGHHWNKHEVVLVSAGWGIVEHSTP